MKLVTDGLNTGGNFVRRVQVDIIGADHQDDKPRVHIVELAVREPPENVLGAVPAVAEIDDATSGKESIPLLNSSAPTAYRFAAPEMRDRIAEHHDFRLTALHQRDAGGVAFRPIVDAPVSILGDRNES